MSGRLGSLPPITGRRSDGATRAVAALVYRGVTTSEIDEPVTRLADRLDADIVFVGPQPDPVPGVEPSREVVIDVVATDAPEADVIVIPGGLGWRQVIEDFHVRDWIDRASATARGVLTISTGSLLLASVGRLVGEEATGHWLAAEDLAALGATVVDDRTAAVDQGRIVMASGALAALGVVDDLADRVMWAP